MNFVVGQLLMHCSDGMSFWLFVELIEEYELREIYQDGLPGLTKHLTIIYILVKKHLPKLYKHFRDHHIRPELYASDWVLSMFSNALPE